MDMSAMDLDCRCTDWRVPMKRSTVASASPWSLLASWKRSSVSLCFGGPMGTRRGCVSETGGRLASARAAPLRSSWVFASSRLRRKGAWAAKGCFTVTSVCELSDQFYEEKHSPSETLRRDDSTPESGGPPTLSTLSSRVKPLRVWGQLLRDSRRRDRERASRRCFNRSAPVSPP